MSIHKYRLWFPSLLLMCICACGPTLTMPGNSSGNLYAPAVGINSANLFLYCPDLVNNQDLVAGVLKETETSILRFPGGTTANFYHPQYAGYGFRREDVALLKESGMKEHMGKVLSAEERILKKHAIEENFIWAFARLVKATDHRVLYVANLMSGTLDETLLALKILDDAGVEIAGVELGNEYYLRAYEDKFASVNEYIKLARTFAEGIQNVYPEVPISLVAAPVANIKSVSEREIEWNKGLQGLDFCDALSVHFYPRSDRLLKFSPSPCTLEEAIEMGFNQPRKALQDLERRFPEKELWLSEWNVAAAPKWCNNSVAHSFFTGLMQESFSSSNQVTTSIYHTLVSKTTGFNLYNPDPVQGLKPLPNAQSFELSAKLRKHLQNSGVSWIKAIESLPGNCLRFSFSNEKKEVKAFVIYNASGQSIALNMEAAVDQHWELSALSLKQGALIGADEKSASCRAQSIGLFLIK